MLPITGTMRASPAGLSKADGDHPQAGGRAATLPAQPAPTEPDQDLVPVGTTSGFLLLRLLSLNGWHVDVQAAPTGGVRVSASRDHITVRRTGPSVAEIACDLFETATALTHHQQGDPARVSTRRGCT